MPPSTFGGDPQARRYVGPRALGQPSHDVRRDGPAEQEADRRAGEDPSPPRAAGQQRQADGDQHQEQRQRQEAAAGAEDRAGEHHAERLRGDRHRDPAGRNTGDQAERRDDAGERGDQGEVARRRPASGDERI